MTGPRALTRAIPDSFAHALAAVPRPIDVALARRQHAVYVAALGACGIAPVTLPADEACPDCVFVEDTALIVPGGDAPLAIITRPGAPSRRAEPPTIAAALAADCEVVEMPAPATVDGGDCMRLGATLYVGRSARTNAPGIAWLAEVLGRRGVDVVPVELPAGVLHLKCVVTPLGHDRVVLAEGALAADTFGVHAITVPAAETYAANVVAIGAHVIVAAGYPRTHERLAAAGFTLHEVPVSEVQKADGSLTCQSIVW